ncbi:MAG: flagellar motor switch protein FliN [Lacipirellulaceae bacterium]
MADGSDQIGQDDIEELLRMSREGAAPAPQAPSASTSAASDGGDFSLGQDEIEALMAGAAGRATPGAAVVAAVALSPSSQPSRPAASATSYATANDIELLLSKAEEAIASIDAQDSPLPAGVKAFRLDEFGGTPANEDAATLQLVRDVQLDLKIELGRTRMPLEDVLRLRREAVVTLDKLAGDPVDVYANGRLIARGEVLVLNDNFCVRVTELVVGDAAVA